MEPASIKQGQTVKLSILFTWSRITAFTVVPERRGICFWYVKPRQNHLITNPKGIMQIERDYANLSERK